VDGHAPLSAAMNRARLVQGEIMAGLGAQQDENLLQRALSLAPQPEKKPRVHGSSTTTA
jgi:hypothetical protein